MYFQRAGVLDAAMVEAQTHLAYGKWVPVLGRLPKPMTADYREVVRHHVVELLVNDSGIVVGLVELIPQADHWLIENVVVDPAEQGKGYGRSLVRHAEDLVRAAGLRLIRLYTNKLFVENIALYLKLGYAIDREEPFKGGYLVHMSKALG
ncbi:MAG: GNAT family N-acetyltransferase [Rhodospirillaceae bacterium]|nr:GNAT family N-acetyltransferase [Rhodospirillaceae bacterium]